MTSAKVAHRLSTKLKTNVVLNVAKKKRGGRH